MLYLRSVLVGFVASVLWTLFFLLTSDEEVRELVREFPSTMITFAATVLLSTASAYWALEMLIPVRADSKSLQTVSFTTTLCRIAIGALAATGFSLSLSVIVGNPQMIVATLFSTLGLSVMVSTMLACQVVHYLGPASLLKKG